MTVGIDLDSRSVAISAPSQGRMYRIVAPKQLTVRAEILTYLAEQLTQRHGWFIDETTYIESPVLAGARNIQSTIKVAMSYGVVLTHIGAWRPVVEVAVSSWKKTVVGNGNANKTQVAAWLHDNHKDLFDMCGGDQNLIDATCIALHGQHHQRMGGLIMAGEMA